MTRFSKIRDFPLSQPQKALVMLGFAAVCAVGYSTYDAYKAVGAAQEELAASPSFPTVALKAQPALTENKILQLEYEASDEQGIAAVALRVTPRNPMPGANNVPVEIPLPVPFAKQISRSEYQDLSARPWAGQSITVQVVVTNESGQKASTDPVEFTLPERRFIHPIARMLVEERNKLMQNPDNDSLREEAANIMANIAQQTANIGGDPVVFMALRSGAVRLVLGQDKDAVISVNDLLWQAAARIENGTVPSQKSAQNARGLGNH